MMVTFPIGAFGLSVASDALHGVTGERKYAEAATLAIDFGLVTAAAAMPFGWVDWFAIPAGTRPKRIGLWHAVGNLTMVGLFGVSRWLRAQDDERSQASARLVSGAAFALAGVGAWLGGELVDRHGIGVELFEEERVVGAPLPPASDDVPTLRGLFAGQVYHDGAPS